MRPLHSLSGFGEIHRTFEEARTLFSGLEPLSIIAERSLLGLLCIAHLEAACIDSGIAYRSRLLASLGDFDSHQPPCIIICGESSADVASSLRQGRLVIRATSVEFESGDSSHKIAGAVEQVVQAAMLAGMIAMQGTLVRRLRPWAMAGAWLRGSLDTTYDPQYTRIKDLLSEEGTIRTVPMPRVADCDLISLKGISQALFDRLRRRWDSMDSKQHASAMSELMLPSLEAGTPSTARLEELGWKRVLSASWSTDMATMLERAGKDLAEVDDGGQSAAAMVETLLRSGRL